MLVSVAVVTYNSAEYIIDLLESIKNQSYKYIELIISDDASKDNTVEVVSSWLKKNKEKFVHSDLVTSPVNTGVSANANRAARKCHGKWIKPIAGDDVLELNAIEVFSQAAIKSNAAVIFSGISYFSKEKGVFGVYPSKEELTRILDNESRLYTALVKEMFFLPAPGSFFNREIMEKLGYFDERIPMVEDYPFWLKCLQNGYKMDFSIINTPLVKYRIRDNSLSNDKDQFLAQQKVAAQRIFVWKLYVLPLSRRKLSWFLGFKLKIFAYNIRQIKKIPQFIPRKVYNLGQKLIVDFEPSFEHIKN